MSSELLSRLQAGLGDAYRIERELGGGGMSRVFLAEETRLRRPVVIKVLAPELAAELSAERFEREILLAAALQHPNIVPVLTAGHASGVSYFTMPFVEGESLRNRLTGPGLAIREAVRVMRDVGSALAYAHQRGVVHRDIKPENVLLSGGAAVVTDFGIAKAIIGARHSALGTRQSEGGTALTTVGTSLGTPAYMAPEQGTADPSTDHRADIYAFGVMAYELLAGRTPFGERAAHALLAAHLVEKPADIAGVRPETPDVLAALVMQCLEKDPDRRPQTAAEVLSVLEEVPTTASAQISGARAKADAAIAAATTAPSMAPAAAAPSAAPARSRRGLIAAAGGAIALTAAAALFILQGRKPAAAGDANLVAVAPFAVRGGADLALWKEGMVDVLSRSLDGAGAIRTVAPSLVIRQAGERIDAATAPDLGRRTGAALVVFGDLTQSGPDSVVARATIVDAGTGAPRGEAEVRDATTRMDRVAERLAIGILRELGGGEISSIGTRSLPALRAFLQGQQHYRRASYDSAERSFKRAVEADSTFAVGWRGLATMLIRQGLDGSPVTKSYLERAIRFNSGLSTRDSLVLLADSLRMAAARATTAAAAVPLVRRLVGVLSQATGQYPNDAELHFEKGDVGFHLGDLVDYPRRQILDDFWRSVQLDSTFLVNYFHAVDVAMELGDTARAHRLANLAYTTYPTHAGTPSLRVIGAVLASPPTLTRETDRLLDSLPARYLSWTAYLLAGWPDSARTGVQLAERLTERAPPRLTRADSLAYRDARFRLLASRGHYARALAVYRPDTLPASALVDLALLGAVPRDSVAERARSWLRANAFSARVALRLWAMTGDTASLSAVARWATDTLRALTGPADTTMRRAAIVTGLGAGVYHALARGDTTDALRRVQAMPDSLCGGSPCIGGTEAELLVAAGRGREALRIFPRVMYSARQNPVSFARVHLLRARAAEQAGDSRLAIESYRWVAAAWGEGDPSVRPIAAEAAAAVKRLGGG